MTLWAIGPLGQFVNFATGTIWLFDHLGHMSVFSLGNLTILTGTLTILTILSFDYNMGNFNFKFDHLAIWLFWLIDHFRFLSIFTYGVGLQLFGQLGHLEFLIVDHLGHLDIGAIFVSFI